MFEARKVVIFLNCDLKSRGNLIYVFFNNVVENKDFVDTKS